MTAYPEDLDWSSQEQEAELEEQEEQEEQLTRVFSDDGSDAGGEADQDVM